MKKGIVIAMAITMLGTVGCSSAKEGFEKSYNEVVSEGMEGMYDTEKEAQEFSDLLVEVGNELDDIKDEDKAVAYIDETTEDISNKIDELASYDHPDAQLMVEGYTLMSESLLAAKDKDANRLSILLDNLTKKAEEIQAQCKY